MTVTDVTSPAIEPQTADGIEDKMRRPTNLMLSHQSPGSWEMARRCNLATQLYGG